MASIDRQDPAQLRGYVEHHMHRLGCDRLERKRWEVSIERVRKGLRARMGVGALIWNERGQVLLVRHHPRTGWDPDKWFTPGGVIEEDEVPEEAVQREVREEVGLEVEVLSLSMVNNEVLIHGDLEADTYFFQFEARATGGMPSPGKGEIQEIRWFDGLPQDMAFREDYVGVFEARKQAFSSGSQEPDNKHNG